MTTAAKLDEIRRNVASGDADVRGRAMQALLDLARADKSVHQEALGIFKGALDHEQSPWAAMIGARGIALIVGEAEGRWAWRQLLNHPREEVAGAVAAAIDASMAGMLLEALDRRPGSAVQIPAMRSLGRMKYAPAFDAIVRRLGDRALRPHAIEALGDLGDVRALDHLKPLLKDKTEAWREDNRGPMLTVRDLAKAAIDRLGSPVPQPPERLMKKTAATPNFGPSKLEPKAPPANPLVYVPIVAALVELPWVGIVLFAVLFTTGTLKTTDAGTQALDLISMAPAVLGLAGGVFALTQGRPHSAFAWLCFVAGMLLCGLATFSFGYEFFDPST